MKYSKLFKNNPFLTYGVIGSILWSVIAFYNIQYDDKGIHGFIYWFSALFKLPFWIVSELLFTIDKDIAVNLHIIITIIGGFIVCLVFDYLYRIIIKRFSGKNRIKTMTSE